MHSKPMLLILKRAKPSWDAFLQEITRMDHKEPHNAGSVKVQESKHKMAVDVDSSEGMTLRDLEMAKKITPLDKRLADLEDRPQGSGSAGSSC